MEYANNLLFHNSELIIIPVSEADKNINNGTFKDGRDNKSYKWVEIGNQVWMAENLVFKPSSGNYWAYDNKLSNVAKYGYLYDWETACNVCPNGWHLPSDKEWTTLVNYLGGENVAGNKMKNTSGWKDKGNGNNKSGFTGLPAGGHFFLSPFDKLGEESYWWSTTINSTGNVWSRFLYFNYDNYVGRDHMHREFGVSIRCLMD